MVPFAGFVGFRGTFAAPASARVKVIGPTAVKFAPASERINKFCPPGPTRRKSRLLGRGEVKPFSVTLTEVIVPTIPETAIEEGYGLPTVGLSGMLMVVAFVNTVSNGEPAAGVVDASIAELFAGPGRCALGASFSVAATGVNVSDSRSTGNKKMENKSENLRRLVGIFFLIVGPPMNSWLRAQTCSSGLQTAKKDYDITN